MEACVVLASLAGVGASANLVHCKTDSLVCLYGESTETHGSYNEMLHDVLNRLYLIYRNWVALEVEEVAGEYWRIFLIYELGVLLELLVVAGACGKLKRGDGLRVPGVLDTVLAVVELSEVWQEIYLGVL